MENAGRLRDQATSYREIPDTSVVKLQRRYRMSIKIIDVIHDEWQ